MPLSTPSKVSVCMPVYNGADYITDSIKSVLAQTYKNFNLIVCDNRSTDSTEEIVSKFKDPRLTYVRNIKNLGLVGNHNRCLELADGKYVHFLHHDDIMLPDNLAHKVSILDENPNVGLVHSDVLFMDEAGKQLDLSKFDAKRDYIEDGRKVFEEYILDMPVGARFFIGAVLARRKCYLKLGGFNQSLPNVNDSEMWLRMLLFYDVACVGKPLVKYRLHNMMTSTAINDTGGLNLSGLAEHHLASNIVIEQYKNKIPQWKNLKKRVNTSFSMKAFSRGVRLIKNYEFKESVTSFATAFKFCPSVFTKRDFWTFVSMLIQNQAKKISKGVVSN